jgi:hypothetical protein
MKKTAVIKAPVTVTTRKTACSPILFLTMAILSVAVFAQPPVPARPNDQSPRKATRILGLQSIERGNVMEGDSLLSIADSAGILNAFDMVRWIPVKAALSRYADAGSLCCRAGLKEPALTSYACDNLYEVIKDQAPEVKRLALTFYLKCALSHKNCDTLRLRQWLCRAYGSFALFDDENDCLRQLDSKNSPSAHEFLDAARERFSQGFFSAAVLPAMEAYSRLEAASEKSLAATIVYQCFLQTQKKDDAALWLSRATLSDNKLKAQAVAFLQDAGYLDKADSLAVTLPSSLSRDTLAVRQALYKGNVTRARELACKLLVDHDAFVVWKVRTDVFSGSSADLEGWIDTVFLKPSWEYAHEILGYRYKLEVLKDAPSAYKDFGVLAYAVWLGQPQKAAGISFTGYPAAVQRMLVGGLVSALLEKKLLLEARKAATQVPSADTGPELQYYLGDINIKQGAINEGIKILEQLVLAHPDNVFAIRAKLVLVNLKKTGVNFP